jgi:hypothetical protein
MRYTLWNIKIIENSVKNRDKLEQILNCEGITDKGKIVGMIEPMIQANTKPTRNDEKQGFKNNFRR